MNKKISDKDKKDWNRFINSQDRVPDKDKELSRKNFPYIEKTIDLHGYTLDSANTKIENFILSCFEEGVVKINIITGKGSRSKNKNDPYQSKDLSILKFAVPNYIKERKNLMSKISEIDFKSINSQSEGSFYIILKRK